MSTAVKPIAAPKKGQVKMAGQQVKRNAESGKTIQVSEVEGAVTITALLTRSVTGVRSGNRAKMLAKIKSGLAFSSVEKLERALHANRKEIASVLSIPTSTLTRRKKEGRLKTDESDRVVRLAQLKDATVAMMQGDDDAAISWLRTPLDILCGESPLQHARTELGARDVEDLIGRIRHGVFS